MSFVANALPPITFGTATLSAGTVTISAPVVTAISKIFLISNFTTTTSTGVLSVSSQTAGTGFTVKSNNILDTQPFTYMIIW